MSTINSPSACMIIIGKSDHEKHEIGASALVKVSMWAFNACGHLQGKSAQQMHRQTLNLSFH